MLFNKKLNVAQGFLTSFLNIEQTPTRYLERMRYQAFENGNFENTIFYCEKRADLISFM
jgi:hypothetical protein